MIEQALFSPEPGHGWLASSPGFRPEWHPAAERICAGFGNPPDEISCPVCLFALPFEGGQVVIVQASDRSGVLFFRLLVLSHRRYRGLGGDPFHLAEQLAPPAWDARGPLPALADDPVKPTPPRSVADVRQVLDGPQCPTYLGGVQALLDGGRLVFERREPDDTVVRALWNLLPVSSRGDLWPASFAYGNALQFNVVVVPRASGPDYTVYLTEEQLGDYPEGTYERALQYATESGDQTALDDLFARRSRRQTFYLGVVLLIGFLVASMIIAYHVAPPPALTGNDKTAPSPTSEPSNKEGRGGQ